MKTPRAANRRGVLKYVRLRPTLPHRNQCSTIGAEGLSFRVRNGAGRFPFAMTAETLWRSWDQFPTVSRELHSGRVASACSASKMVIKSSAY